MPATEPGVKGNLAWPDYRSCRQGSWQDCWLLAALVGLAFKRPEDVARLCEHLGDGCYRVAFPGRTPVVVRESDASGAESGPWPWAAVIEAAANRVLDAKKARVLSFGIGIELLTGGPRTGYTNLLGAGFAPAWRLFERSEWFQDQLEAAAAERRLVVLGGSDGHLSTPKKGWISPRHCYALLDYDRRADRARIRDPHGNDNGCENHPIPGERKLPDFGPGEFWLCAAEVEASFCGLSIECK